MHKSSWVRMLLAGAAAGTVTGLFGAGGGMILVPALGLLTDLEEETLVQKLEEVSHATNAQIVVVTLASMDGGNIDEFIDYLERTIASRFTDDYFNLTLPNELNTSSAISPAWYGYIASQIVLNNPMLFSTSGLAKYLLPNPAHLTTGEGST